MPAEAEHLEQPTVLFFVGECNSPIPHTPYPRSLLKNESDAEQIALMVVESGPPQAGPWNGQQDGGFIGRYGLASKKEERGGWA